MTLKQDSNKTNSLVESKYRLGIKYILITCVFLASCGQQSVNDLSKSNLKGKVKQITEYYFLAKGNIENYEVLDRIHGESNLVDNHDEDAILSYSINVEFNIKGNKKELVTSDSTGDLFKECLFYNERGLLLSRAGYMDNNRVYLDTFEYDHKDREIRHLLYDHENTLLEFHETKYTDNQIISSIHGLEESDNNMDLQLLYHKISTLNKKGLPICITRISEEGSLLDKRILSYNKKNQLIKETFYDSDDNAYQESTSGYDDNGNEIEFEMTNLIDNKNIVRYSYQYRYDALGNWIEQLSLIDGLADNVTRREINYYTL